MQPDLSDVVDRLQKENDALKSELAALRANRPVPASVPASEPAETSPPPARPVPARPVPDTVADAPRPVITRAPMTLERPAAVPVHAPAAHSVMNLSPTATGHTHTVEKGDTLMNISQHYYGTRSKWRDIYAANRDVMKSENDLKIGMQLKIP
jgi:nucleoid-associated protein YgaU